MGNPVYEQPKKYAAQFFRTLEISTAGVVI